MLDVIGKLAAGLVLGIGILVVALSVAAVALGYLIFGDFPNPMTWAGIAVIVSSGLYVIHRERQLVRQARLDHPTPVAAPQSPL